MSAPRSGFMTQSWFCRSMSVKTRNLAASNQTISLSFSQADVLPQHSPRIFFLSSFFSSFFFLVVFSCCCCKDWCSWRAGTDIRRRLGIFEIRTFMAICTPKKKKRLRPSRAFFCYVGRIKNIYIYCRTWLHHRGGIRF